MMEESGEKPTSKQPSEQAPESWKDRIQRILRNAASTQQQRKRAAASVVLLVTLAVSSYAAYHKYSSSSSSSKRRKRISQAVKREKSYQSASIAPLSLLLTALENGSLQKVLLGSTRVFFQTHDNNWKRVDLPNSNPAIQKQVLQQISNSSTNSSKSSNAEISVLNERDWSHNLLTGVVAALPFVYLALVYRMLRDQMGSDSSSKNQTKPNSNNVIKTTFRDVAGLDEAVTEVSEIVHYLRNPTVYHRLGATAPRGVLLHGPPGTGKTLLAQAVAGQAAVDSFTACSASDFVELYVGRGAARVRRLFATARAEAKRHYQKRTRGSFLQKQWWSSSGLALWSQQQQSNPSSCCSAVIFIDELDALAKTRAGGGLLGGGGGSNDEREQTLNQLLTEMDGFHKDNDVTVVVIAATNRADVLDPAIRRRFDRQVQVGYPDCNGRKDILEVHARHIQTASDIDLDAIAVAAGDHVSGADLRNLINEAALLAVREGASNEVVSQHHLEHAARRIRQMKQQWSPIIEEI